MCRETREYDEQSSTHSLDRTPNISHGAHNAGQANVDKWVRRAGGPERFDTVRDIPFPETRAYVRGVFERQRDYRAKYARELGY